MSVHNDQIASVLRRTVQEIISRGLNDPRVRGMISVTQVKVTDDLRTATAFVSVLPAEHAELTVHGLRHAAQHIRTEIGRKVRMRRMPQLVFKIDESLKREAQVFAAINGARREDDRRAALRGDPSAPDRVPISQPAPEPTEDPDP